MKPEELRGGMTPLSWFALLFVLSVAFNVHRLGGAALGPGFETTAVARALAKGQGFSNPFEVAPTGPTAHLAPVYPALLGGILMVFGETARAASLVLGLELFLQAMVVALLPGISKSLFGDRKPGVIGAILMIVLPVTPLKPAFEPSLTALLLIVVVAAAIHKRMWLCGGLLGALGLTNPAAILAAVPIALHSLGRRGTALALLLGSLVCSPWIIRNYMVLGAWIPIRDNFGLELSLANDDCAGVETGTNSCLGLTYPRTNRAVALELASVGEAAYSARRGRQAERWIAAHPKRFFDLTAARIGLFWFPHESIAISAITAIGFLGLWLARGTPAFGPLIGSMCAFSLPYYVVSGELRRRQPIMWMTALVAGYAITQGILYLHPRILASVGRVEERKAI